MFSQVWKQGISAAFNIDGMEIRMFQANSVIMGE